MKKPASKPTAKKQPASKKPTTTPIMASKLAGAAKNGELEVVQGLLDRGIDPNVLDKGTSALAQAVYWDRPPVVELLLASGANPNLGTSFPAAGGAMHAAAARARVEMLARLIAHGGEANVEGQRGVTPLHSAIRNLYQPASSVGPAKPPRARYLAVIDALIAAGGRPDRGVWEVAIRSGDRDVFERLLDLDPAAITTHGTTWLRSGAQAKSKLVEVLLERGVPADLMALHIAASIDNTSATAALLARGVDAEAVLEGKTALQIATERDSKAVAKLLKAAIAQRPQARPKSRASRTRA